jgi:hypothetical protein
MAASLLKSSLEKRPSDFDVPVLPKARRARPWAAQQNPGCSARADWSQALRHQICRDFAYASDHIGNVELFPQAMLLVQECEYNWPLPSGAPCFKPEHPVTKLNGDHDVFGDGSVTIVSTPGHTPGHQSLLAKLPSSGAILLSGDVVHFKANWEHRRVPSGNADKEQLASMQ